MRKVLDPRVLELPPGPVRAYAVWADRLLLVVVEWAKRDRREIANLLLGVGIAGLLWWAAKDWVLMFILMGDKIGLWLAAIFLLGYRLGASMTESGQKRPVSDPPSPGSEEAPK